MSSSRSTPAASFRPSGRMWAARASQRTASSSSGSGSRWVRLSRCNCSRCSSSLRNSYDAVMFAASSRPM
ncbi:Uncharacterised protein [Mycobacterium tuberculosis]|nr:Uncharacterised protein [Mycobacterium tuberculosis]